MAVRSLVGLDHAPAVTSDLTCAARRWQALGFPVTPLCPQPAVMGTANRCIVLGSDHIVSIGIVPRGDRNVPTRKLLVQCGNVVESIARTGTDAEAVVAEPLARDFTAVGAIGASRPICLPRRDARQACGAPQPRMSESSRNRERNSACMADGGRADSCDRRLPT